MTVAVRASPRELKRAGPTGEGTANLHKNKTQEKPRNKDTRGKIITHIHK